MAKSATVGTAESGTAVLPTEELEIAEFSFMGSDNVGATPSSSSRTVTVKMRRGSTEVIGQHAGPTRLLSCIYHAMMDAAVKLGIFSAEDQPKQVRFSVESCNGGSECQGTFTLILEYRGHRYSVKLYNDDLATGSRQVFLTAILLALKFPNVNALADPANPDGVPDLR